MKKTVDFYIVYEHWQRELFGVLLLERELKNRGYSVEISSIATNPECDYKRKSICPKIVIYPWIYNDYNLMEAMSFKKSPSKVINMQSEQILNGLTIERHYKQNADNVVYHVCWGDLTKKRFANIGIENKYLKICGNINFDINHKEYNAFFESKKYYADKYNLDINKKWVMFFSDFIYFPEISEFAKSRIKTDKTGRYAQLADIQKRTRMMVLTSFKEFLLKHPDYIIIYRPKPTEAFNNDEVYKDLSTKCSNFRYIADGTIQEWIHSCDMFLTCDSTSIIDVQMQGKHCAIMRPFEIPDWYKSDIFKDVTPIVTQKDLENFLCKDVEYPYASKDTIREIIGIGMSGEYAYKKLADWLEELYVDSDTKISKEWLYTKRFKIWIRKMRESKGGYLFRKLFGVKYIKGNLKLSDKQCAKLGIEKSYYEYVSDCKREEEWRSRLNSIIDESGDNC